MIEKYLLIYNKADDGTTDVKKSDANYDEFRLYDFTYSGTHMGERKITSNIESPTAIEFNIGEKVLFRGHYFYIQTLPIAQRVYNSLHIAYTITFNSVEYELGLISFQDVVMEDPSLYQFSGNLDVFVYGTIEQLMSRIIANTERAFAGAFAFPVGWEWDYKLYIPSNPDYDPLQAEYEVNVNVYKDIAITNGYCSDALALINSLYGLTYTIRDKRTILVSYPPNYIYDGIDPNPYEFKFGYDLGICEINRIQNDSKIITRAIGYGSDRNINPSYRAGTDPTSLEYHPRLMLPKDDCPFGYVEALPADIVKYGVREGICPVNEKIYPSIVDTTDTKFDPPRPLDEVIVSLGLNINDSGVDYTIKPGYYKETLPSPKKVGDSYGGGVVIYLDPLSNGHRGIIVSLVDSPITYFYESLAGGGIHTTGANELIPYSGIRNTTKLLINIYSRDHAVKYCTDLVEEGYDDWKLPAKEEMFAMWETALIAGVDLIHFSPSKTYWTSSETGGSTSDTNAICYVPGVSAYNRLKNNSYLVRPIRYFNDIDISTIDWIEPEKVAITVAMPTTVSFTVYNPGFSVFGEEQRAGVPPKISFLTGNMQGMEFIIKQFEQVLDIDGNWTSGEYKVTVDRNIDDPNHPLPSSLLPIFGQADRESGVGDKFVYLDIYMPDIPYVSQAEERLLDYVEAWLADNINQPNGYTIKLTEEWIKINPVTEDYIRESNAVTVVDDILGANDSILVQGLNITYKESDILPTYDLTVSTTPITSAYAKLQAKLRNAEKDAQAQQYITNQEIRNAQSSTYVLASTILTTNKEINGGVVAPSTLKSGSLTKESRDTNYVLQAYFQVNYLGDENSAMGSAGVLIHKDGDLIWGNAFDTEHQTWTIPTPQTFTLVDETAYWVYIKGSLIDGSAEWVVSETRILPNALKDYFYFEWGQINPVIGGFRFIQSQYGQNGVDSFVYIAYASDDTGTDFTLIQDPLLDWIAIKSTTTALVPPVVGDFDGLWFNRRGTIGGHLAVTIAEESASVASIDGNQVLTISPQVGDHYTFNDTLDVDLINTSSIITANTIGFTGTFKDADGIIFDVLNGLIKAPSGQITVNKVVTDNNGVIDDNSNFSVTITGQLAVRPYIETKTFSQDTPAVFTGLPYDTYIVTEDTEVWVTEVTIDDNEKVILVGEKQQEVTITNHEHTFTECDPCFAINYGLLYNWYAATDVRGICPSGWHVPVWNDLYILRSVTERSLNGYDGAFKLYETGTTYWATNVGTDNYGMKWRGAGGRDYSSGIFSGLRNGMNYTWIIDNSLQRWEMLDNRDTYSTVLSIGKERSGCSIRLVKDDSTNNGTVTDFDGNVYPTVKIGNQVWMARNLVVKHYNNGDAIANVTGNSEWAALTTGAWCYYGNTESNGLSTCRLQWSSASNNLVGYLTVGNLVGTGVTIGDYVIEWRLGSTTGDLVLTTGIGSDASIQRFHPFTNEPVISGNLYATIKWVVIDGVTYSSYRHLYGQYSPDLLACLGYVTVAEMNCSNSNTTGNYQYLISYVNTVQVPALASRTIRFILNTDGTSEHLAWRFIGFTIADRIRFYYVSGETETLLTDWAIGLDNTQTDYASSPKKYISNVLMSVLNLTGYTYVSGDYIKIQIDPSYNDPSNTNTNWSLYLQCFTTSSPFDCTFLDNTVNELARLDEWAMVWNVTTCAYELTFYTTTGYTPTQVNEESISNYFSCSIYGNNIWSDTAICSFSRLTTTQATYGRSNAFTYVNSSQSYTITKTGSQIIYQFQNITDYNTYKNGYDLTVALATWTNYNADGTNINHYKWIYETAHIAATVGDTYTVLTMHFPYESTWTFDDETYTITIDISAQTNEFVDVDCSSVHETLDTWMYALAQFRNMADFSYTTGVTLSYPLPNVYLQETTPSNLSQEIYAGRFIPDSILNGACPLTADWYLSGGRWYFWHYAIRVIITDAADPENNWQLWSQVNEDGTLSTTWTLIKEVP